MALDIVEELRQDREKGAKRLESEYKAGLMTLAMRFCSSQSDAEELVNRTFAAVVAGIDDYLEQSAFFGWMCQILKNLHSLDMRRKSNRCEVCTGDVPETADDDAQEAIYRSLDRSIVRAAIETLEPEEKEALLLHYFMDIPIKRMAKILAAPEGTVKRRLHFARKALAAKLGVAAKKSGVKAMLAILALCALTAIGAGLWRIGVAMFGTDDTAAIQQGNSSMESGVLEPDITSPLNADSVIPVSSVQSQGSDSVDNSQSAIPSSSTNQVPTRQEKSAMKKSSFLSAVLGTMFATGTVAQTAGSTVAWWHFDEEEPGTTATAAIAASGTSAPLSATPVSFSGATATASSGDWLPIYAKPFQGLAVYDPVTDTTRTNRAAMKFQTAESGKCGGALHAVTKSSDIYGSTANAITVEAFVCTTGGVFSTFAPIVACMQYENWTSEKWAIYEETDGTLALRFDGTPYYSGNSGQAGTAKINDGAWHHVAFTWDGSTVKIFVDYEQDKFKGSGNARQFTKTTTLGYNYGGQWDYTRIGGYKGQGNETTVWRRFNGLVDEVRVSNVALTPDKFLRMQPLDMDGDEVLRVSFDPGEYGAVKADANLADALGPNRQKALYKIRNAGGSAAFDTAVTPSAAIGSSLFAAAVENAASFSFATNGTGADAGCYVQAPSLSSRLVGGSATNFTIECFFKTRGRVRGATSNRQTVFKLGSGIVLGQATLSPDTGNGNGMEKGDLLLVYRNKDSGNNHYDSTFDTDLDDGAWHHVAFVIDGDRRQERTYVDGRLSHRRTNFDPGATSDVVSLFVGCGYEGNPGWKPIQFFDGWIDNLRVTKRALSPEEFLSAHPFGKIGDGPQPLLLTQFNGDYGLVCASKAAFSVTGRGEARTGGNVPAFVDSNFGILLPDGTNGTDKVKSVKDVFMNRSRVVFQSSPLYELDAYTVEFWAKFTDILTATGSVERAAVLPVDDNLGIIRCTQGDSSAFDWYLYRGYWAGNDISIAIRTGVGGGTISYQNYTLDRNVVDGRWHHYALTFEPSADTTKTLVSLYDDYALVETKEVPAAYVTRAGRVLKLFEGSADHPNLVGLVNSFRISRGVLESSQFLGRVAKVLGFSLIIR